MFGTRFEAPPTRWRSGGRTRCCISLCWPRDHQPTPAWPRRIPASLAEGARGESASALCGRAAGCAGGWKLVGAVDNSTLNPSVKWSPPRSAAFYFSRLCRTILSTVPTQLCVFCA